MNFYKKIRFFVKLFFALIKKQYKIIFLGVVLGILLFFIVPNLIKFIPKNYGTDKIGLVGLFLPDSIPDQVLNDLSYGLTKLDKNGEAKASLSESWIIKDNGKVFEFKVSPKNIYWHDNTLFNINDINFNFKDIDYQIEADIVRFILKEPFSPLPGVLSRPIFKIGLIGLGDYKVKKIENIGKYVKKIELSVFKNSGLPNKIYKFYKDENELLIAFNLGEIDIADNLFSIDSLSMGGKVNIKEKYLNNVYIAVFFNTGKTAFSNKSFRQALAYAIPKEKTEIRATGPIDPGSWAYNPDVKPYNEDLAKAKQIIETEKAEKNKIIISSLPQYEQYANLARDSWQKLGIEAEVRIISIIPDDFDVLIAAREIPNDPDQYYFWHSTQEGNITKFKSPRIDKLLEDGRIIFDKQERKNIYFDFQRYLVEESPVIFLAHPKVYSIRRTP